MLNINSKCQLKKKKEKESLSAFVFSVNPEIIYSWYHNKLSAILTTKNEVYCTPWKFPEIFFCVTKRIERKDNTLKPTARLHMH